MKKRRKGVPIRRRVHAPSIGVTTREIGIAIARDDVQRLPAATTVAP
jgi:hypothetical protein